MSSFSRRIGRIWHRQVTSRLRSGPYRFLIHRWKYISDIDVAAGALETQFYDSQLVSQPLPVSEIDSFLVLAPHQDDEAIGAGGTLLLAKNAGADLHILFLTDGRSKGPVPYADTPDEVVKVRKREAEKAGEILGAKIHHLGINNARPEPTVDDLNRLFDKIKEISPKVLLVPWLLDTPKHRLANHLLWLTDRCRPLPNCEIWGYQVHNSLIPNGYVDITEVAAEKQKLIECYPSQIKYIKRFDHIAMGMAIWNCRFLPDYKADPVARYVEVFCALPLREHLNLIESFYLPDLDATYRGIPMADGMKKIHREVMDSGC